MTDDYGPEWACIEKLAELLGDDPVLAVATVTPAPPETGEQANEHVFCTGWNGTFEAGPSVTGPLVDDNNFTIDLEFMTRHSGSQADCMKRLGEMRRAIRRVVAANPDLAELQSDEWSVTEIRLGAHSGKPFQSPEGAWAYGTLGVDVEVRHYGGNPA